MRWNATYRYRSTSTDNQFVDGGSCYVDPTVTEQLRETDYGKEVLLGYKMYVKNESRFYPTLGDVVEISMQDGQQFLCTIVGNDFTVHKVYTFLIASSTPKLSLVRGRNDTSIAMAHLASVSLLSALYSASAERPASMRRLTLASSLAE